MKVLIIPDNSGILVAAVRYFLFPVNLYFVVLWKRGGICYTILMEIIVIYRTEVW